MEQKQSCLLGINWLNFVAKCNLSVVITNYNYGQYLKEAIASALAVSDDVIVIDDASTDNSKSIIFNSPNINWGINVTNIGVAECRNWGISIAKHDFVICLDADDTLSPELKDIKLTTDITGIGWKHFGDRNDTIIPPTNLYLESFKQNNQIPVSSPFSKEIWKKVGGFRTMKGYEDWDFWVRCLKAGATISTIQKPLLNYRIHANSRNQEAIKNHNELLKQIHEDNK